MSTATTVIPRTYRTYLWTDGSRRTTTQPAGFLAAGHWQVGGLPTTVIYPRPDSETASYAAHHWAYYDGSNPVEYRIPIIVQGMALPYVFELISGPPGMSIPQPYWIPGYSAEQMLALGYGDVVWTPTAALSAPATVVVRVYGQNCDYVDVTWTVNTSSSVSQFIFLDAVNGNDSTGTGSITAPWQTLAKVYSAAGTPTSTYPGAILYLRAGTYFPFGQSISGANNPVSVLGFPGEAVLMSLANCPGAAWNTYTDASDFFFYNFGFTDVPTTPPVNFHYFACNNAIDRITAYNIDFGPQYVGTDPRENATCFYCSAPGAMRSYIALKGLSTDYVPGLPSGSTSIWNVAPLHQFYQCQFVVTEFCTAQNMGWRGPGIKASNSYTDVRFCRYAQSSEATYSAFNLLNQTDLFPNSYQQLAYNIIDASQSTSTSSLSVNNQRGQSGALFSFRNSYLGPIAFPDPSADEQGPYSFSNDAIEWITGSTPLQPTPTSATNTGTQCQAASGVFSDPANGDYSFTSTYASYTGTRGAQVA